MIKNSTDRVSAPSLTFWLYAIFFASGISGLMYEVVWVRMLTRILGSTSYATSTVLAVFMAGLGLGSFLCGRFIDRVRRPLIWYAALEIGIGLTALISLLLPDRLVPLYRWIYETAGDSRPMLTAGQVLVATVMLLVPTSLMGATLPVLCAYGARRSVNFARCAGTLYAANTLGAVVGVLASGFILLGAVGETNTIIAGALVNAAIAGVAFRMARGDSISAATPESKPVTHEAARPATRVLSPWRRRLVVFAFFGSGFVALANEVLWGRMLVLCQGTSIYAFSSMLAVVLLGIGAGSWVAGRYVDRWSVSLMPLARVQLGIGLAGLASLYLFGGIAHVPQPSLQSGTHLHWLIITPLVLLGPMALLWGATFPVAVRCYAGSAERAGRDVSVLYVFNTLGSILGASAAGFWLIGRFGVSYSATGLAVAAALLGVILMVAQPKPRGVLAMDQVLILICATAWLGVGDPYFRIINNRAQQWFQGKAAHIYKHIEESGGTTTAFGLGDALSVTNRQLNLYRGLWVNGESMTVLCTEAKLMAYLPLALVENPRDVLVICFGMGTTVRSASYDAKLDITAVELLPGVVECVKYFHPDAQKMMARPNVHVEIDDGRNYLLMHDKKYDVITIDPAPPLYSAGTVNLYTREFFELVRARLKPGGMFCLWIPPANEGESEMVVRTFLDVFPHADFWTGPRFKGLFCLGSETPITDVEQKIYRAYENLNMRSDLIEWELTCGRPEQLLEAFVAHGDEVRKLYADVPAVTDDRPYTEFPLWRAIGNPHPAELTGDRLRQRLQQVRSQKATD